MNERCRLNPKGPPARRAFPCRSHFDELNVSGPFVQGWRAHADPNPPRRSHLEELGAACLDILALRQHRDRIRLEQFQRRQRRVTGLFLDLRMERAVRVIVDQQLLESCAEEETLEQPRGPSPGRCAGKSVRRRSARRGRRCRDILASKALAGRSARPCPPCGQIRSMPASRSSVAAALP